MLKIYHVFNYVSIDGAGWRKLNDWAHIAVNVELVENQLTLDSLTFDEVYKYLSQNYLLNVWSDKTFLRHKPIIRISYAGARDPITYRHFNTMSYKTEYIEYTRVSLDWLMKHLSADQCIQYLKDRGMAACPILK